MVLNLISSHLLGLIMRRGILNLVEIVGAIKITFS